MFGRLSKNIPKVIMMSQEESRPLGHTLVGIAHTILGLLGEGNRIATDTVRDCGITLGERSKNGSRAINC